MTFFNGRVRVAVGDIARGEAAVASRSIAEFLDEDETIREVRLVFFSTGDMNVFLRHHQFVS
jgi:hypothetical protein